MALFFLNFEIRYDHDYGHLYNELKNYKAVEVQENTWCLNRNTETASDICEHFQKFLDPVDSMVVIESKDWARFNTKGSPHDL